MTLAPAAEVVPLRPYQKEALAAILASVVPTPCWGRLTVHHVVPRGMGGTKNDTSELVTACAGHHDYIELNREWARARGFLRRATA